MDIWFTVFALVTSLLLAGGGTLILVGYIGTVPAALSFGWRTGIPALLLPVVGPLWFAFTHGPDFRRAVWQLIAGSVLLILAGALLLGLGPHFADQMVADAIEAAKMR